MSCILQSADELRQRELQVRAHYFTKKFTSRLRWQSTGSLEAPAVGRRQAGLTPQLRAFAPSR